MSKQIEFGVNYKHLETVESPLPEGVYLAKISGADFFLKEIPDSVILTRGEMEKMAGEMAKHYFYAGFYAGLHGDANCYTAWREENLKYIKDLLSYEDEKTNSI